MRALRSLYLLEVLRSWKTEENPNERQVFMSQVRINITGVCHQTRGPGAWGAILSAGLNVRELSGSDTDTTQHRVEMEALITALSTLKRPCQVEVVTNSEYLLRGSCDWLHAWKANGWNTSSQQPVRNVDLWMQLDQLFQVHSLGFRYSNNGEKTLLEKRSLKLANKGINDLLVSLKASRDEEYNRLNRAPDGSITQPIKIYTDGSCLKNRVGGWGAVILKDGRKQRLSGGVAETTGNRMEMVAAIQALKEIPVGSPVRISTDSQYVRRGMDDWLKQWKKSGWLTSENEPVKNTDLWQQLDALCAERQVAWKWIKGHSGHPHNELADKLARDASANFNRNKPKIEPQTCELNI